MTTTFVRFVNIFVAALVVGVMFGIWLGYNPAGLTAAAYVEQQQAAIRGLNVLMPILGAIGILLTLLQAWLVRSDRASFYVLLTGAALLITAGLITRFGNQPINARVITWSAAAPPSEWGQARDLWWQWHVLRTFAGLVALGCIIAASLKPIGVDRGRVRPAA